MKTWRSWTANLAVIGCSLTLSFLAACGGDTSVRPTETTSTPVASAPAPAPAAAPAPPAAVPDEGENLGYLVEFEDNAGFKVTNKTKIGQAYRAYTTNFDNQEVETAFKISGTVPPNESWGSSFNASCVQLDITQHGVAGLPLKGGAAFFDKNGKQFNPSKNPEKVTECRTTPCKEEWVLVEAENSGFTASSTEGGWGQCSQTLTAEALTQVSCSQSRRVRNTCTGEIKTETQACQCSCEQSNPNYGSANGSGSKTVTTHPGTPSQTIRYYTFSEVPNDGDSASTSEKSAYCVSVGGQWGDWGSANSGNDPACKTINKVLSDFNNSGDNDLDVSLQDEDVINGTPDKYSLSVSSSWSVAAGKAQTLTFEIVYNINSDNFVKKSKSQSFECGQGGQGSLTWGPGDTHNSSPNYSAGDGHITGSYTLRVKRGATVVGTFPLP